MICQLVSKHLFPSHLIFHVPACTNIVRYIEKQAGLKNSRSWLKALWKSAYLVIDGSKLDGKSLKKGMCQMRFNPFLANAPILYPLVFSGGIKWEHWPEMG